ncbi:MAG: aminotransferase class V-fold PLP-dependent enzyme, partial [Candidatus Uhrbacteria bacterium]|nr:aminotransferase class V-fold PLP-dependent enzyme [Candidatus Uhrbacteria bacterium]
MHTIYLDHAATTPMDPRVVEVMQPYFIDVAGNPSSFHTVGLRAKEAVTEARQTIARLLSAREDEILFTSGGTESDNLAVMGIVKAQRQAILSFCHSRAGGNPSDGSPGLRFATPEDDKKPHVMTSAIEHHAVLEPLLHLQKIGEIELTVLPVNREGLVAIKDVRTALKLSTVLVSIMFANNEIGTIEPIADIGREILAWRKEHITPYPLFHTDACQAAGAIELNVEKLHVDLLTMNGSKIYGPKGVGILYIRRGIKIEPLM